MSEGAKFLILGLILLALAAVNINKKRVGGLSIALLLIVILIGVAWVILN